MKLFSPFSKRNITEDDEDENISENESSSESILGLVSNLSSFECDGKHSRETQDFDERIEIIYKNLIVSLLNGNFLREKSFGECLKLIYKLEEDFEKLNVNEKSEYTNIVKPILQILVYDFKLIISIKVEINNNRKRVHNLDILPRYEGERKDYMKLLLQIILILSLEKHIIESNSPVVTYFANIYVTVDNLKFVDENFIFLQDLVKERIKFDVNKFIIVYGKRYFFQKGEENEPINWDLSKDSIFFDEITTLKFFKNPESTSKFIQEFQEKKELEDSEFRNLLILNELTTYYKGRVNSIEGLEWIIEEYDKVYKMQPSLNDNAYVNYVYIQNNYLSLLIKQYENGAKNNIKDEREEVRRKIEKTFSNLNIHKRKTNFKNYFTYYKYARYKYLSSLYVKGTDIAQAKKDIMIAEQTIENAIDIFDNDDFYEYFEYDIEGNTFKLPNSKKYINKLYVCNLYCLPFNFREKRKELKLLQDKILKLEIEIINDEKVGTVDKKINDYKVDIMTVVGIFTAIVVYSFGTIQIFSIIENIGDALMFSGFFLSGMLMLLFGVFLYKGDMKKTWILLAVSLTMFFASLGLRCYFKDGIININKGENTNHKLENSIYKATLLEESLQKMINTFDKGNSENTENVQTANVIDTMIVIDDIKDITGNNVDVVTTGNKNN